MQRVLAVYLAAMSVQTRILGTLAASPSAVEGWLNCFKATCQHSLPSGAGCWVRLEG